MYTVITGLLCSFASNLSSNLSKAPISDNLDWPLVQGEKLGLLVKHTTMTLSATPWRLWHVWGAMNNDPRGRVLALQRDSAAMRNRSMQRKPDKATSQRCASRRSLCVHGAIQSATTQLWTVIPCSAHGIFVLAMCASSWSKQSSARKLNGPLIKNNERQ